jgi:hypothetical protein
MLIEALEYLMTVLVETLDCLVAVLVKIVEGLETILDNVTFEEACTAGINDPVDHSRRLELIHPRELIEIGMELDEDNIKLVVNGDRVELLEEEDRNGLGEDVTIV